MVRFFPEECTQDAVPAQTVQSLPESRSETLRNYGGQTGNFPGHRRWCSPSIPHGIQCSGCAGIVPDPRLFPQSCGRPSEVPGKGTGIPPFPRDTAQSHNRTAPSAPGYDPGSTGDQTDLLRRTSPLRWKIHVPRRDKTQLLFRPFPGCRALRLPEASILPQYRQSRRNAGSKSSTGFPVPPDPEYGCWQWSPDPRQWL